MRAGRPRKTVAGAAALAAAWAACVWAPSAGAGVVADRGGVTVGPIRLAGERVVVGKRAIAGHDVRVAVVDTAARALPQPNVVRWRDGQVWPCEIVGMTGEVLTVRSPWFGAKSVPVGGVAALEFRGDLAPAGNLADESLHRLTGRPLPGRLLWIGATQIAVDSPLGAMALARSQASRYLPKASATRPAAPAGGEVLLLDGTLLHGPWSLERDTLTIQHKALGSLRLPLAAVRALRRCEPGVTFLADTPPHATGRTVTGRPSTDLVRVCGAASPGLADRPCLQAIRIEAGGRIELPVAKTSSRLRATLLPLVGLAREARVRIQAGGKILLERKVAPGAAAAPIDLALPAGKTVAVDVDWSGAVRFPCGVLLADAHLVHAAKR